MSENLILKVIEAVAAIATLIIGGFISIKLGKLHTQINSRMDQLLIETQKSARAEGKAEEKEKNVEALTVQSTGHSVAEITGGEIKITTETRKKK